MASMYLPTFSSARTEPIPHKVKFASSKLTSTKLRKRSSRSWISLSRDSELPFCCRCANSNSSGGGGEPYTGSEDSLGWNLGIMETVRDAIKRFDGYLSLLRDERADGSVVRTENGEEQEEWDWERWKKHFVEVDEQEEVVSILKSQLASAIEREDYEEAARIKVAIAAAAKNDTVGRVMFHLKEFVEEERYGDAALIRDYAGAGLVGWWAGISDDANEPHGRIIHIRPEYGRYIARSYSPRQLATASDGAPVFEVYLTNNKKSGYKQQAVYLKLKGTPRDVYVPSSASGISRSLDSRDVRDNNNKLSEKKSEDTKDGEDIDDNIGFDNVLRDVTPGPHKVVKVTVPEKMFKDLLSQGIENIIDDEEEENDYDLENVDVEDQIKSETDEEQSNIDIGSSSGITEENEQNQFAVDFEVIVDDVAPKVTHGARIKDLRRVPARLERKGRMSFTFTVEDDANENLSSGGKQPPNKKKVSLQVGRDNNRVMLEFVMSVANKGMIPMKVLQDLGELINHRISQAQSHQSLSGSTTFNRIDVSSPSDPLNGLYIGSHGLHASEVIHLTRRCGQWKEDANTTKPSKVEFYEYVEAVNLIGNAYVPAGQVVFRAKVGKKYQLPHKGIIPEEFSVIARYKGQGRLNEPGMRSSRWVDGELVILDGKYIKGGPVVGFVYWAPEFHFLEFYNRLRLE